MRVEDINTVEDLKGYLQEVFVSRTIDDNFLVHLACLWEAENLLDTYNKEELAVEMMKGFHLHVTMDNVKSLLSDHTMYDDVDVTERYVAKLVSYVNEM